MMVPLGLTCPQGTTEFSIRNWEDRHGAVWAPIPSTALLWATGLIWHGHDGIQLVGDHHKARRMARNHPDVYEVVEVEPD